MAVVQKLTRQVPAKIRERGKEYFTQGSVRLLKSTDSEIVAAEVEGTSTYDVILECRENLILFSCSCPYYDEHEVACKHVWAVMLAADRQGRFAGWDRHNQALELVPVELADVDDSWDKGEEDIEELLPSYHRTHGSQVRQTPKLSYPNAHPKWKECLAALRNLPQNQPDPSWITGKEIVYIIGSGSQGTGRALFGIEISLRERKMDGAWGKPRPTGITYDLIPALPDEQDRMIIARLFGARREPWYSNKWAATRFEVSADSVPALLTLICRTGRCLWRETGSTALRPMNLDPGPPWEFRLEVRSADSEGGYEIAGVLCRDDERLDISQPDFVFDAGVFVRGGLLELMKPSGGFEWIPTLRREQRLRVPADQTDSWLEEMFTLPCLPPLDLPEELRLSEVPGLMRPFLKVHQNDMHWRSGLLTGTPSFEYAGRMVNAENPLPAVADCARRQLIRRDFSAEQAARERLLDVGFRLHPYYGRQAEWMIPQRRFARAVRDLVSTGWQVEAEGKLFRCAGSFNLSVTSGIDWFELHGEIEFGETKANLPALLAALKRREHTILLDDGTYGVIPEQWLKKYGMLAGLGKTEATHLRFRRSQTGLLDALLASEPQVSCDEVFERARAELGRFEGITPAEPPPGFKGELRGYQRDGLGWIHFLREFGFGGCLADDMGLGKTIQVLALLESRRTLRNCAEETCPGASLVVVPRSLVFNWKQEAARFVPLLRILDHTGPDRTRGNEHFEDYDLVLTTYGTLRRDASFFKDKEFDYVILDEAQAIKNASTESAKAARLLHGRHRLALSGTPIENHLGELWSLFEFLNPGMLGSASAFRMGKGEFSKPDAPIRTILARALRPFLLRRTKSQVAPDLPEKLEQTLWCELEPAQRRLYDDLRAYYRRSLLDRVEKVGLAKAKIHVLEALLRLRQAAIHPGLIDRKRINEPSAKLDMLMPQLIEVIDEGHKVLVFSQFTSMLDIVRRRLDAGAIRYEYLDGQTRNRALPVETFQNDPGAMLFLISLKAGGLGLNLTAAEYVFLLDPWWNPAVEAQAIDRTHRIGQSRPVFAYRLIAKDTVEEKVLELQKTKRTLAEAIISEDNSLIRDLRKEDLELLLG